MIFANSPEAKGRVERVNQTLQDRLVKEMRLLEISTVEAANVYIPTFIQEFNTRFAVIPRYTVNSHRPLEVHEHLDTILIQKHDRVLSKQLTLSYGCTIYQIQTKHPTYAMRHATVQVHESPEGAITIQYKQQQLDYTIIQKQPSAVIGDSKQVNHIVDQAVQRIYPKPPATHYWKQPHLYW